MNPLFRNATRALKDALRREFRAGQIGQLVRKLEREKSKRGGVKKFMREAARKIHGPLSGRTQSPLPGFDRYAKQQKQTQVIEQIYSALGPLGDVIRAFMRPQGRALTSNSQREASAASAFLKSLGFEVIPPPPKRGGKRAELKAVGEYLGKLGFKIVPDKPALTPAAGQAAGPQYKPLPGWAQRAHAQQAKSKPHPVMRQEKVRKTIDVDFGDGKQRRVKLDDPILTGAMIPVVSSNVHSIGFDINTHSPAIGTLKVRFLQTFGAHGGGKVAGALYEYYNVPTEVFRRFQKAASKGKFVWDNLRIRGTVSGHKFDYSLQGISRGYVPRKATLTGQGEAFVKRTFLGKHHRTGEVRLFQSRDTELVRPFTNGRPGEPNRGRPNRGRK